VFDSEIIVARAEIQDLLVRYCRGIDRADVGLVKSVYHPGATDNHGVFNGDAADFAEFAVTLLKSAYHCTQHQLSNMIIDVDGDTACAETYFVAYHAYRDNDSGIDRLALFGGRYADRLEKRDGCWGIVARTVIHDWSDDRATVPYEHTGVFRQGGYGVADPTVDLFTLSAGQATRDEGELV